MVVIKLAPLRFVPAVRPPRVEVLRPRPLGVPGLAVVPFLIVSCKRLVARDCWGGSVFCHSHEVNADVGVSTQITSYEKLDVTFCLRIDAALLEKKVGSADLVHNKPATRMSRIIAKFELMEEFE